jgi:hypothetical protein
MKTFLLTQNEQLTEKELLILHKIFFKISRCVRNLFSIGIVAVAAFPVYAIAPLTDAELDTSYLVDNTINPSYAAQRNFEKSSLKAANKSTVFDTAQSKQAQFSHALDADPLLAAVSQNIRLSGTSEFFGIPVGVSSTGTPLGFGSESYSSKWSGNLTKMHSPVVMPQTIDGSQVLGNINQSLGGFGAFLGLGDGTSQIFNTLGTDVEIISAKNQRPVQIKVIVN